MSPENDPNYLKLDEAARFLRVTSRTVYRRIWSGELPAAKVGGLYYIKRTDLEALLEKGRVVPTPEKGKSEPASPSLKCGFCFRMLTSDSQIADVCHSDGCDKLICTQCVADGIKHCAVHFPDREERIIEAQERHSRGEIPLLVKSTTARLREMNFLNRIQSRLARFATLAHPSTGEVLTIADWEALANREDDRSEIMRILGKVMLDVDTLAHVPINPSIRYHIPAANKVGEMPLEITLQSMSRLPVMLRDGFDTRPMTDEDLLPWISRITDAAQRGGVFHIIVLASVTGWDISARQTIQGEVSGHLDPSRLPFSHHLALFYLFDMEDGQLSFNLRDDRVQRYAELFVPLSPSEEVGEVMRDIEKEFEKYESLTLQYASQILPYQKDLIRQAFQRLASSGRYAITEVPELGDTLVRSYST